MLESSWLDKNSCNMSNSLETLTLENSGQPESGGPELDVSPKGEGRRRKAALVLVVVWSSTIALHLVAGGFWFVMGLTSLMGVHAVRLLLARPLPLPDPLPSGGTGSDYPFVSLLVAAKNEAAVIGALVRSLCELDYPADRYEVWVIDDNSTDQTLKILEALNPHYAQLNVLSRHPGATGGKSGVLNQVLPLTKGEIIGAFDADAQVPSDLLRRMLPLFAQKQVGAVQVHKAIANPDVNFWTRGENAEMALDAFLQQQRIAIGGIGELRGNGQFVRRVSLQRCGGWNEDTITDDLDLTLRLHLDHWDIEFLILPAVGEEGLTRARALWHQRNRWAEGGYQRYLDYWPLLVRNRLGTRKTLDLTLFWINQYLLPTAAVPDMLMATVRNQFPLLLPMTSLAMGLSMVGMFLGLTRIRRHQDQPFQPILILVQSLRGTIYMLHWFLVVASMTVRVSIRPKRLKWVKTVHQGSRQTSLHD
jgi:1,2-diacylglycerol 3-beta-glucosyltransferase